MYSRLYSDLTTIRKFKDLSIVKSEQKKLNITPVHQWEGKVDIATFGMGCFWGAESLYGATHGVVRTTVGYAGGNSDCPTYNNLGDHTEVVEINYDPQVLSYNKLLELFWLNHEYSLGTNVKQQYRSIILCHDQLQRKTAESCLVLWQSKYPEENITTKIETKLEFFPAESYHQKYRLQQHNNFYETLHLNPLLLQKSYVATKLNGYFGGVGNLEQFAIDKKTLGLTRTQEDYCQYCIENNKDEGTRC